MAKNKKGKQNGTTINAEIEERELRMMKTRLEWKEEKKDKT